MAAGRSLRARRGGSPAAENAPAVPKIFERIVRSRWYVAIVMTVWVFEPEVRRIVDWRSTFHSLSLLSVVPIASLLPGILIARRDWSRMGASFRRLVTLWLLGFGYALVIALLSHPPFGAIFSLANFCVPIAFGILLAAPSEREIGASFDRFADVSLIVVALSALYGLYQYAAPPPWDTYWAQQANIEGSQGETVAFGFRIWGTLNSTGPFAEALMIAVLLNLRRLSFKRWYIAVAFMPIVIALALTSVRGCWIGLALGTACYLIFAASRLKVASAVAIVGALVFAAGAFLTTTVKDSSTSVTALTDRIATLGALNNDASAEARRGESAQALVQGLTEPLGEGLGALGTAAKLTSGSAVVLDNGYLSRFLEMGVIGFALYVATLVFALLYAFKGYARARRSNDVAAVDIFATAIAMQIVLAYLDVISDTHVALGGMLFWATASVVSLYGAQSEARERSVPVQAALRLSAPNR